MPAANDPDFERIRCEVENRLLNVLAAFENVHDDNQRRREVLGLYDALNDLGVFSVHLRPDTGAPYVLAQPLIAAVESLLYRMVVLIRDQTGLTESDVAAWLRDTQGWIDQSSSRGN